jgi:hypothetical protein
MRFEPETGTLGIFFCLQDRGWTAAKPITSAPHPPIQPATSRLADLSLAPATNVSTKLHKILLLRKQLTKFGQKTLSCAYEKYRFVFLINLCQTNNKRYASRGIMLDFLLILWKKTVYAGLNESVNIHVLYSVHHGQSSPVVMDKI